MAEGHVAGGKRSGFGSWQFLGNNCTLREDPLFRTVCALGGPWGRTAWLWGAPLFKPEPVSSSRGQPHETISGGRWSGHEKDLSARSGEETNYQPEVVAGWGWGTVLRAGHSCIHLFNRH